MAKKTQEEVSEYFGKYEYNHIAVEFIGDNTKEYEKQCF